MEVQESTVSARRTAKRWPPRSQRSPAAPDGSLTGSPCPQHSLIQARTGETVFVPATGVSNLVLDWAAVDPPKADLCGATPRSQRQLRTSHQCTPLQQQEPKSERGQTQLTFAFAFPKTGQLSVGLSQPWDLAPRQTVWYRKSRPFYVVIYFSAGSNPDQRGEHGALLRPSNNS